MTISKFASSTLPRHGMLLLSISGLCAPAANAQTSEQRTDAEATTLDTLKVQGQRQRRLESPEAVGSRLGLTQRETPASLQVIDHTDIATQGARTTSEVFDMVAGAMVGNVPGNPAVVTMRGFSGNTISVLHDGVRLGASTIVTRNLDTVGLERVEVLRGPASVLYGEGALGGATGANSDLLRWRVDLPLGNHWSLQNDLSWYQADRDFFYSDNWIYTPATGQLSRTAERIQHDQRFWNERLALSFDGRLGRHRNRFTAGMEHNDTKFHTPRQTGVTTPVSPLDPVLGVFPDGSAANFPGASNNVIFDSRLRTLAVFAENVLNLTARWILLAGARVEKIQLSRDIRDVNTGNVASFRPDYRPFSWRVGTVFDLTPEVQLYGHYATAVSPVSTLLTMRPAAGVFDLSKGKSLEAGIKANAWGKRIEWTAAAYRIERDNILTRDPANPSISVQGGAQSSQGVELSAQAQLTRGLRLDLAAAYGTARYDRLLEAGGADRSGKRPPNVPDGSATLAASYRFLRVPLSLGASSRNVGGFSTDNANTIHVGGHTTFDAWVGYDWQRVSAVLRVRNLSDALYGTYSGYPSTHIYLGAPRSIELTLRTRF
ncbi:TonB-dependent receptor [Xanthomonas oryzae pv. oryzae]|nr:TonB-dependent receptor [Xanthomonas oryzae]AJQ82883.1 ligand-gated channel [Xanthomonas oryzae pv. oryzae PXO86]ALZ71650.1 ligand-gated channel [Xanthomonas oryzae pv. oryzae]AOS06346.1 ligand-gated channel [Xanthomonas oryzae pv. oryzae]AOS10471.1 ligand-gated channel [Xanthomonas oryzae pv. oryzae]AOS14648.1 ligand-gated channel [Xanthomonas oryzae pv. oryzae]